MRTVTLPNEILLPEVAEMLSEGKQVVLKVKGNSMLPFIVGGRDSVVLEKKEVFAVGDIVLAEIAPKRFVLHRIIDINGQGATLMGDGNLSGTEACAKENIHGYAAAIIRKGRRIDCHSGSERFGVFIWKTFLPLRRYLLAIYKRTIINI